MNNVWTLTWLTFHEARRRRMVLAGLLLGVLFVALYILGLWAMASPGSATDLSGARGDVLKQVGLNFLATAGLYVVHFLTIMLAIFASVDAISGEITSHTIQAIATKPVRRWEIVLGKWLGYALMLVPYLAFLGLGVAGSVYLVSGYVTPNLPQVIGVIALEALILLSLSLLGGTRMSTLTNGVVLFMLYGLAFIGSWVEQIGDLLNARTAVDIGIVTSLLMPVEALWRMAAGYLEPPIFGVDKRLSILFGGGSPPSTAMLVYAALFALGALLLAMRQFSTRDL